MKSGKKTPPSACFIWVLSIKSNGTRRLVNHKKNSNKGSLSHGLRPSMGGGSARETRLSGPVDVHKNTITIIVLVGLRED